MACNEGKHQLSNHDKCQHQLKKLQTYMIQVVPWQEEAQCCTLKLEGISSEDEGVQQIWDEYPELLIEQSHLPPSRPGNDHSINLQEGANPVNIHLYRYLAMKKEVIEGLIEEMLAKGAIQHSSSPFASPVVLVKNKDGGWRMCVDYRALNKLTIKNRYPIPLIEDLFDELGGATVFSKLDLKSGYHQIKMKREDCHKTAFQTHSGHFEFLVMPFGITNAPATFQNAMNMIFKEYLRKFVLVFFDDILVYNSNMTEHGVHLRQVFDTLKAHQYVVRRDKCMLAAKRIEYLGHFISAERVATDSRKVQVVQEWPVPKGVKQLKGFLGLTGYYRRFVKGYGVIAKPLTNLLRKGAYQWSEEVKKTFQQLKQAFITAPILALPNMKKPFTIETDASQAGIGAVLMQDQHPRAFISKMLSPKNKRLSVYDKELLAVVYAVEKWHHYLAVLQFTTKTDQKSLKFLMEEMLSTLSQFSWLAKLMGMTYNIQYKKGVRMGLRMRYPEPRMENCCR